MRKLGGEASMRGWLPSSSLTPAAAHQLGDRIKVASAKKVGGAKRGVVHGEPPWSYGPREGARGDGRATRVGNAGCAHRQ